MSNNYYWPHDGLPPYPIKNGHFETRLGTAEPEFAYVGSIKPKEAWIGGEVNFAISNEEADGAQVREGAPLFRISGPRFRKDKGGWTPKSLDDHLDILVNINALADVTREVEGEEASVILKCFLKMECNHRGVHYDEVRPISIVLRVFPFPQESQAADADVYSNASEICSDGIIFTFPDVPESRKYSELTHIAIVNTSAYGFAEAVHGTLKVRLEMAGAHLTIKIGSQLSDASDGWCKVEVAKHPPRTSEVSFCVDVLCAAQPEGGALTSPPRGGLADAKLVLEWQAKGAASEALRKSWAVSIKCSDIQPRLCVDLWPGGAEAGRNPVKRWQQDLVKITNDSISMPDREVIGTGVVGGGRTKPVLSARVWLAGVMPEDGAVAFRADAALTALTEEGQKNKAQFDPFDSLIKISMDGDGISKFPFDFRLSAEEHACILTVSLPTSWQDYNILEENFPVILRLDVNFSIKVAGRRKSISLNLSQIFDLVAQGGARNIVAVDLGVSSLAVAVSGEGHNNPQALNLGAVLFPYDGDNDEVVRHDPASGLDNKAGLFIASYVGLGKEKNWRAHAVAESLAGYFRDGPVYPAPEEVAARLDRTYLVSLPFAPASALHDSSEPVVFSPKMLLTQTAARHSLDRSVRQFLCRDEDGGLRETREINVQNLISDVLHEVADLYVMWDPAGERCLRSRVVLTHPNRYSKLHKQVLRQAAQAMCARLGSKGDRDNLFLVSESDAVAYYFLKDLHEDLPEDCAALRSREIRLLVFDLGAGTLDLSLVNATIPENAAGFSLPTLVRRVGAAVGGDSIDLVLYFLVHHLLQCIPPGRGYRYEHTLVSPDDGDADDADGGSNFVRRNLSNAIRRAKKELGEKCRDVSPSHYHWPDNIPLRIKVGEYGAAQLNEWPLSVALDAERSLSLGKEFARLEVVVHSERASEIHLVLDKRVVNSDSMSSLMGFMAEQLLSTALDKPEKPGMPPFKQAENSYVLVSGRASLWPLVYERLEAAGARLAYRVPKPPEELKKAVCVGAIMRARNMESDEPLEGGTVGILNYVRDKRKIQAWNDLEKDIQKDIILTDTLYLAEVPMGTDIDDLRQPWAENMVLTLGEIGDTSSVHGSADPASVELKADEEGHMSINIGGKLCEPRPGGIPRARSVQEVGFRVREQHAPPRWAATVDSLAAMGIKRQA